MRDDRRTSASASGSWMSISSQVSSKGSTARAILMKPSVRWLKLRSSISPVSGPMPSRNAAQQLRDLADEAAVRPAIEKARHRRESRS